MKRTKFRRSIYADGFEHARTNLLQWCGFRWNSPKRLQLEASIKVHSYDRAALAALVGWLDYASNHAKALVYAQRLKQLDPGSVSASSRGSVP